MNLAHMADWQSQSDASGDVTRVEKGLVTLVQTGHVASLHRIQNRGVRGILQVPTMPVASRRWELWYLPQQPQDWAASSADPQSQSSI